MSVPRPPSNFYAEILPTKVMILGGGASTGKCSCHEGRVLKNGISALIKVDEKVPLSSSSMQGYSDKVFMNKWALSKSSDDA